MVKAGQFCESILDNQRVSIALHCHGNRISSIDMVRRKAPFKQALLVLMLYRLTRPAAGFVSPCTSARGPMILRQMTTSTDSLQQEAGTQMTTSTGSLQQEAGTFPSASDMEESSREPNLLERWGSPRYVCAPMVEQSDLPFRLLVRRYGCTLAYTPMIHSGLFSMPTAQLFRDQHFDGLGASPKSVVGYTGGSSSSGSMGSEFPNPAQPDRMKQDWPLVAQFCGNDPETVVLASKHVQDHVDAVDLNLGCPQRIARKGNYGAYLLADVDLCASIVRAMSKELSVPVTAKVRCLPTAEATVGLALKLQEAGAQLLTLHGRTLAAAKTNQGGADWDIIRRVKQEVSIPLIANGGIETKQDCDACLAYTGADAVMSSEALLENPALFDPHLTPLEELQGVEVAWRLLRLSLEYVELAKLYGENVYHIPVKTKAHVFKMLHRLLQLERNHDLRTRLGARSTFSFERIEPILAELALRYSFDPVHRQPLATAAEVEAVWGDSPFVSRKTWYRRHRSEE